MNAGAKIAAAVLAVFVLALIGAGPALSDQEALTLERAVALALENNDAVKMSRERISEAEAQRAQIRSGFLPRLGAQAGYTYISEAPHVEISVDTPLGEMGKTVDLGFNDNYLAKIELTQPLFLGGRVYYGYKAAVGEIEAREAEEKQAVNDLIRDVARAYYGVLFSREFLAAAREMHQNAEAHLVNVENGYREGTASRLELLTARVQVSNLEPIVTQAENALQIARTALYILVNVEGEPPVVGKLALEPETITEQDAIEEAYVSRPEFAMLDLRRDALEDLVRSTRAGYLPSVFAGAAYQYQKPYFADNQWYDYWTVTAGIKIPLFEGLETSGKTDQVRSQMRQIELAREQAADGIRLEIRSAILTLKEAMDRAKAQSNNVEVAEEALAMAEVGYREGVSTNLDVMDVQMKLLTAKTNYLAAVHDALLARNDLHRAMGRFALKGGVR